MNLPAADESNDPPPQPGQINLGDLRRVTPLDRAFGGGRGRPVDRYYIERFLAAHRADIRGRVLELENDAYTRRFGGAQVTTSDVLNLVPGHPSTTIGADLTQSDGLPAEHFDCVIFIQALHFIYDAAAVVGTLYRILKPGGVLLATLPGISQVSRFDMDRWGDYWRFTTRAAQGLFGAVFGPHVAVESYGNVLSSVAFLMGMAQEELAQTELDFHDPDYQLIVSVRCVRG